MLEFNRTSFSKNLSGFRSVISETARFPFLCKNLAVFASENPQILFLAKRQRRQEAVRFCLRSASQIFINSVLFSKNVLITNRCHFQRNLLQQRRRDFQGLRSLLLLLRL